MKNAILTIAAAPFALGLAACGHTEPAAHASNHPVVHHTLSAAQVAINKAVTAACKPSLHIYDQVNSNQTVGSFDNNVAQWEAELTAADSLNSGVPHGPNAANEIAVDYAKANFALSLAGEHDNPFSSSYNKGILTRGYNQALSALQDVLNRCAAAGQG